jgi:hypothetical protein
MSEMTAEWEANWKHYTVGLPLAFPGQSQEKSIGYLKGL